MISPENKALYQATDIRLLTTLSYAQGSLLFSKNKQDTDNKLIAILRTLRWEGQPDRTVFCFCGKIGGVYTIAQPYAAPALPWWLLAYDIAYTAFWGVQVVMGLDMALHLLQAVKGGVQYLARHLTSFYQSATQNLAGQSTTADSLATLEEVASSIEVINTDTNTDIDTDIDDVAVTNVDTDTDTDIDIDIDTSIPIAVEKNIIPVLLMKVRYWLVETGFPKLVENLEPVFMLF